MRKTILATAVSRLAALGYHATSIKKIAQAGKFSVGALQHHFPTKEDLMVAVVDRALERAENYVHRRASIRRAGAVAGFVADTWRDQIQTDWFLAMLEILVAARTDAALRNRLAPAIRAYGEQAEKRIADLVVGPGKSREAGFLLTISRCMMAGLVVQDALAMPQDEVSRFVGRWGEFVADTLRAERAAS